MLALQLHQLQVCAVSMATAVLTMIVAVDVAGIAAVVALRMLCGVGWTLVLGLAETLALLLYHLDWLEIRSRPLKCHLLVSAEVVGLPSTPFISINRERRS